MTKNLPLPLKIFVCCVFMLVQAHGICQSDNDIKKLQSAIHFYEVGTLDKSLAILTEIEENNKEFDLPFNLRLFTNLGNVYADNGNNVQAIVYYTKALQLARKNKDNLSEAQIIKNIGAIYMSLGRFSVAEKNYNQSLAIGKILKNEKLIADCNNNLGTIYEQTSRLELAKLFYFKSMQAYKKMNRPNDVAMVAVNLAIVYKAMNDFDSSIFYNQLALVAAKQSNDQWVEASVLNNLGNLYSLQKNTVQCEKYLYQSLALSKAINAPEIMINVYDNLAENYSKVGEGMKAYQQLRFKESENERFNSLQLNRQIDEIEIKYKTKQKELKNLALEKDKQKLILFFSIVVILLIGVFYLIFKYKKNIVFQKNQKELNKAMLTQEAETRITIAQDLHDHIGQKIAVLSLYSQRFPEIEDEFFKMIQNLGSEVRKISHNLVPESFDFGLARSLEELKEELLKTPGLSVELTYPTPCFETFTPSENLTIYRIIQEIIANILKHSQASKLSILIYDHKLFHTLAISDNGIGFDTKLSKKSIGLGWKNIEARLQMVNGSFKIQSILNKGTTVTLLIPTKK